ncbi:MAG: dihydrofolate reductase [Bdellovibrionales bacterium]|jgi:dihydrofolate reductase|nr:dihydrofolate reductase [Bdellovibrionales bacterium]
MILSSIAAMARNRTIGRDGDLPWDLPEDMRYFRKMTSGHIMIMGRKTLESFPKLLPGRFHIIVTRQEDYSPSKAIVGDSDLFLVVTSVEEALEAASALVEAEPEWGEEVFCIGGGEIYTAMLPMTDKIYLTEIGIEAEGDAHFPRWHEDDFNEVERRTGADSETNGLPSYEFVVYQRANL